MSKKLDEANLQHGKTIEEALKFQEEQNEQTKKRKGDGYFITPEYKEKVRLEMELRFGSEAPWNGKIVKGEELISFDKYIEYAENMQYIILLHSQRMVMLTKLINKSFEIRNQERIKKQMKAHQGQSDIVDIEMDLYQINAVLKNEIGKDIDMIESFMQESLKAIYITILEYLTNVPQEEPEFLRSDNNEEVHQKQAIRESIAQLQASMVLEEQSQRSEYEEDEDADVAPVSVVD